MSDIVEILRAAAKHPANDHGPQEWLNEAADEIERLGRDYDTARDAHDRRAAEVIELRAALREIAGLKTYSEVSTAIKAAAIARAALGGGDVEV